MHHQENNVFPFDLSSTAPYQRDSPLHLLHYANQVRAVGEIAVMKN